MAFLMKPVYFTRLSNGLLKNPYYQATKVLGSSHLHTEKKLTSASNVFVPLTLTFEPKNDRQQPLLSACEKLTSSLRHSPLILPSLPNGKASIFDLPTLPTVTSLEMPTSKSFLDNAHIMPVKIKIEEPVSITNTEKLAHRMLVIRRQKMKKHRKKKFRKRNRIVYARIRLARKVAKEARLQTRLLGQMTQARGFSARKYAFDLLCAAHEKVELPPRHIRKRPWEV